MEANKVAKKVFSFNFTLPEPQLKIVNQVKETVKKISPFKKLTNEEKVLVINRIIHNMEANNKFNSGKVASFYLTIYNDSKKEFEKGMKFQINGEVITLSEAKQTGSNNEIKLNNGSLKLSGTSFKFTGSNNHSEFKANTFASLLPLPKPAK